MKTFRIRSRTALAAAATCALSTAAGAADMTLTPAPGSAVIIQTPSASPALRVPPSGIVELPAVGAAPASLSEPLCLERRAA